MASRTFTIEELTEYLHLNPGDVERLMRESNLPHTVRGGRVMFEREAVDEWASKRILGLQDNQLDVYHAKSVRGTRRIFPHLALIPELMHPSCIDLALPSKTRPSVLRDVVGVAERTGRVFDPRELVQSIEAREELASTAVPGGIALLHARRHEEYRFEGSFIALGRTIQPVPFGAPDGRPTQLFFLICCEDDRIHLHTLARLCLMALKTNVTEQLKTAATPEEAFEALVKAEESVLPSEGTATSGRIAKR